jgi:hypothetical protein
MFAYNVVRLPSPVKAPIAIDVIWLVFSNLREQCLKEKIAAVAVSLTYNSVKRPRPVKAPLAIDVIWLRYRYLFRHHVKTHAVI